MLVLNLHNNANVALKAYSCKNMLFHPEGSHTMLEALWKECRIYRSLLVQWSLILYKNLFILSHFLRSWPLAHQSMRTDLYLFKLKFFKKVCTTGKILIVHYNPTEPHLKDLNYCYKPSKGLLSNEGTCIAYSFSCHIVLKKL